jgi:hypothetical protein
MITNLCGRIGEMITNREQRRRWKITFAAPLVTGGLVAGASAIPPVGDLEEMARGPIMAIIWLSAPAILTIGSIVSGLVFHAVRRLWAAE